MNIIDIVVLLLFITGGIRGFQVGIVRQLGSTLGFVLGVLLSIPYSKWVVGFTDDTNLKMLLIILMLIVFTFGFMAFGEYASARLKFVILKGKVLNRIDSITGIGLAVLTVLLGLWVSVAVVALMPVNNLQRMVRESFTFNLLDRHLPPASQLLSTLNNFVDINDIPLVFSGREPSPQADKALPPLSNYDSLIAKVSSSIVRIQGIGCGGIASGSGFVYASNRVVTNAHVVAGVKSPKVYDHNGTHDVRVVAFDPKYDIAILAVNGLAGTPIPLDTTTVPTDTIVLTMGFPGGGKQTAHIAAILETVDAVGRDIYLREKTERNIHVLQAGLIPGDSGGPVLDEDGRAVGIVFGTSTTYNNIGYALTLPQIMDTMTKGATAGTPVSTGACSEI